MHNRKTNCIVLFCIKPLLWHFFFRVVRFFMSLVLSGMARDHKKCWHFHIVPPLRQYRQHIYYESSYLV
ncbi:hypothetical protein VNO77_04653 [Canavalia gladiata]|uniref:Uncharacterized protein n=1 Tax=Canavalia gladiata TaxID=3824 RepID=A0AAN9R7Z2_CANGL